MCQHNAMLEVQLYRRLWAVILYFPCDWAMERPGCVLCLQPWRVKYSCSWGQMCSSSAPTVSSNIGSNEFGLARRTDHHRAAVSVRGLHVWLIMAVILFFFCCPDKRQIRVKIAEHKKQKHWFRMVKWFCKVILLRFWYTVCVWVFSLLYFPARCHAGTCSFMIPPFLFFLLLFLLRHQLPVLFTKEVISSPGCRCWWLSSCSDHNTDSWKHAFLPVAVGLGPGVCLANI